MSTSAAQDRSVDEESLHPLVVTELDYDGVIGENDRLEPIHRCPSLSLPGRTTNRPRRQIPVIEGIIPTTILIHAAGRDTTTGWRAFEERGDRHAAIRFLRPARPEYTQRVPLINPSTQRATTLAFQRPLPPFPHLIPRGLESQRPLPPFPYQIPRESEVATADPPFPYLTRQPRSTATVRPSATLRRSGAIRPFATLRPARTQGPPTLPPATNESPVVSPIRYQSLTRAHAQVEVQVLGQQVLERDPRPPGTPVEWQVLVPAQAEARQARDAQDANQPRTPTGWQAWAQVQVRANTQAGAETQAQAQARREARRQARRDASPPPSRARERRSYIDHRFRNLLSRYHWRAALPTRPSRPPHSGPSHLRSPHGRARHSQPYSQVRRRSLRVITSVTVRSGSSSRSASGTNSASTQSPSITLRSSSNSSPFSRSSHLHNSSHAPNSPFSPRLSNDPPPLTRTTLTIHALSPVTNPHNHSWHSLALLTRIHNLRTHYFRRARALLHTRRAQARERARQRARDAVREAERVRLAITNLALCGALADSRAVLWGMEEGGGGYGHLSRASARAWIPTAQIITPTERHALRGALALRSAIGERMGFLAECEEHYGRGMGRWVFDVWIAGAVTGTGERIGVVWRGPPAGDEEGGEFDGDDGIAEWHFIDGGDARHVRWDWEGVGEGWVEWVEGRRGGLFVVHDVFR